MINSQPLPATCGDIIFVVPADCQVVAADGCQCDIAANNAECIEICPSTLEPISSTFAATTQTCEDINILDLLDQNRTCEDVRPATDNIPPNTRCITVGNNEGCTEDPNFVATQEPTTDTPTTDAPTTDSPTTDNPTTDSPTTDQPTTDSPTTDTPTTDSPTTDNPTTDSPTTDSPTTDSPTTDNPTTDNPTTDSPTTDSPTTNSPTTDSPTTDSPTTDSPTTASPTTDSPTTDSPTTAAPTTFSPTTQDPTTANPTTAQPTVDVVSDISINVTVSDDELLVSMTTSQDSLCLHCV